MTDNSPKSNPTVDNQLYVWNSARLLPATQAVNGAWYVTNDTDVIQTVASNSVVDKLRIDKLDIDKLNATRITTDTRKIQAGDIFLALVGDNFDGHDFLVMAEQKGAVAAIVSQPATNITIPQLLVDDTRLALGQLAKYRRLQHPNIKIIALTGSSGKTSVKEMLRSIFAPIAPTLVTRGNLNNDLGVPMMLLELQDQHRYAILELGANHVGEIAYTTELTRPDVACVLNVGTAHLGEFGGRDNIAKTKAEIYQTLDSASNNAGFAIVPLDDDYFSTLYEVARSHTNDVIGFGEQSHTKNTQNLDESPTLRAQVYATDIQTEATQSVFNLKISSASTSKVTDKNQDNSAHVLLPLAGKHNISNALAASACAYALGITLPDIAKGLTEALPANGRLQWRDFAPHRIIDDTYNANPNSVMAGADVLAAQPDYKILILGDIGELGASATSEHQSLGRYLASTAINSLLCVGQYANDTVTAAIEAGMNDAHAFDTKADLLLNLKKLIAKQEANRHTCTMLFKGSRSTTMETLITDLIGAQHIP